MKKLSLILCFLLLLNMSAAFAADASDSVNVTEFNFLVNGAEGNVIAAGDSLSASFKLAKNPAAGTSQSFTAVLQITKLGEVIKAATLNGSVSVSEGEKEFTLDAGEVGSDIAFCEITFHLVSDLTSFTPLAPIGTFNCTNPLINKIRVESTPFFYEDSSVYTAASPRVLPLMVWADELPLDICIEPADLTTKLTYNDVTANGGVLTVSSVAHSGARSETVADISLDIPAKDQLSSISVGGAPIADFSKDKYEYVIPVEGDTIPEITYEKVDSTAADTYIPAEQLPGKSEITVSADGSEKTYTVIFAKKINIPLLYVGYKRTGTGSINVYDASNLPATRTVQSTDASYADYTTRRTYLEFDSSVLPANAVVASGSLTLNMKNAAANTSFTVDVFTALDKDWYANSASYKAIGAYPRESQTLAYTGEAPAITSDAFSAVTYNLNPAVFDGVNDGFNLVLRQTYNALYSGINTVSFAENELPVMELYYYIGD